MLSWGPPCPIYNWLTHVNPQCEVLWLAGKCLNGQVFFIGLLEYASWLATVGLWDERRSCQAWSGLKTHTITNSQHRTTWSFSNTSTSAKPRGHRLALGKHGLCWLRSSLLPIFLDRGQQTQKEAEKDIRVKLSPGFFHKLWELLLLWLTVRRQIKRRIPTYDSEERMKFTLHAFSCSWNERLDIVI